ncbi:MAG: hypothetical protein NTY10_04505 [Candidatus Omnitrophica bacterium]|nr:hypothetical protein [Candidatus Omnitrophota bacterium]
MNGDEVFALAVIFLLLLAGLWLFFRSILRILPRIIWVAGTPTSPIRSLAIGLVEVTGKVKQKETIPSPATGLECCLTKYKLQELRVTQTRNGRTTSWHTTDSGFYSLPFYLQDKEGAQILIDPNDAELYLPCETYYPNTGLPTGAVGSIRYLEEAIYPNALLYALGEAKKKSRFADLNDEVNTELAILRGNPEKMATLDENKDGQIDTVEWEKTVRSAESRVAEETIAAAQNPLDTIVIAKPSAKRPFIISTRSEKEVLSRLRWKGYSTMILGLALVFFNLAGILGFFFNQPSFGKNYYKMVKLMVENIGR